MVTPWIIAAIAAGVVLLAELLHRFRLRRVAQLAFGPTGRAAHWTAVVPWLRAAAVAGITWGMLTLIYEVEAKVHRADAPEEDEWRHLVLVLDVSPSMRLQDAGPKSEQSRLHRARDVVDSMFNRVSMGQYKTSVVATYNGALPVVIDTLDIEVVRNVMGDLPMHFAFKTGETRLFDGLEEAAKIAKPWLPKSTTVVVLSDGDTLPPTGMPTMPPSVSGILVVGVGDPQTGSFIAGRHSKQDVSALRQMAARLGGTYHDGNKRHVASTVLSAITQGGERSALEQLTLREYALLALLLGAALLALLPVLLHFGGTSWRPGTPAARGLTAQVRPGPPGRHNAPVPRPRNDDRLVGQRSPT